MVSYIDWSRRLSMDKYSGASLKGSKADWVGRSVTHLVGQDKGNGERTKMYRVFQDLGGLGHGPRKLTRGWVPK